MRDVITGCLVCVVNKEGDKNTKCELCAGAMVTMTVSSSLNCEAAMAGGGSLWNNNGWYCEFGHKFPLLISFPFFDVAITSSRLN